jgi:Ribbon-helix-helix protein, copG family
VVAVRLPPAIVAEVDLMAEQEGVGRSDAIRRLLEKALAGPQNGTLKRIVEALERGDVGAALRAVGAAKRRGKSDA